MNYFKKINVLSVTFFTFAALTMNLAFADQKGNGSDGTGKKKTKSSKSSPKHSTGNSKKKGSSNDKSESKDSGLSNDSARMASDKSVSADSKKSTDSVKESSQKVNKADVHEEAREEGHEEAREERHEEAREEHREEAREERHEEAREEHREEAREEHREEAREEHREEAREERREEAREERREAERREEHREAQNQRTDVDVNIVVGGPVVVGPRVVYAPIRHRQIVYRPTVVVFDPGIQYSVETSLGSTSLDSPFEQFLERDPTLDDTNGIEVRECGVSHLRMYFSHSASIIDKVWVVYGNNEVDLIDFAGEQFQPAASSEFIPIDGAERCVKRVFIKGRGTTSDSRVELVGRYRMDLAPTTFVVNPFVWNASVTVRF